MASTPTTYLGGQKFKSWTKDQLFWLTFLKVSFSLLRPTPFLPTFTPHYHSLTIRHLAWYSIKYGQNEDSSLLWCNTAWAGSQRHSLINVWWRSQSPNSTYQCPSLGLMPVHHSLSHHISNWFATCHSDHLLPTQHSLPAMLFCLSQKMKALQSFQIFGTTYPKTQHNILDNLNLQQCYESLKSHTGNIFTESKNKQIKIK